MERIGLSSSTQTNVAAAALVAEFASRSVNAEVLPECEVELAVRSKNWIGAIDLSLVELVAELLADSSNRVAQRLTNGPAIGLPLVIVPGGCDTVVTNQSVRPIELKEVERLAKDIAQKASASSGPVSIVVPMHRWSESAKLDREPARVFVDCLRLWLSPSVRLHTMECGLGDAEWARRTTEELLCLISAGRASRAC